MRSRGTGSNKTGCGIHAARTTAVVLACLVACVSSAAESNDVATVYFPSGDGTTELVGYLFTPPDPGVHPAVVLLHGRAGPYSSNVNRTCAAVRRGTTSPCNASSLSQRHVQWATYWTAHGRAALVVDSFGPRGKAAGFGRNTHGDADRDDVNEKTVRPLDAEGALAWLAVQPSIRADRIDVQGWSNGASTVLNGMQRQSSRAGDAIPRFGHALAFYPGCGPAALLAQRFESRAPVLVLLASDDEEVSPKTCRTVMSAGIAAGANVEVVTYEGATHDFDDPGARRHAVAGNRDARRDAMERAAAFFDR